MSLTNALLFTLGLLAILGPFGTDVYLPALPQMATFLHTTPSGIQLVLTAFSVGMAGGQLIMGPLSDRIGRRPLLIAGPALMAAACLASAYATNLGVLLATNTVIGIAACAGMVVGRAQISDLATDRIAARGFAVMGIVTAIGPIIGPIGGGLILGFSDWRGIYLAMAIFSAALVAVSFFGIPESLSVDKRHSGGLGRLIKSSGSIFANRNFILHAVTIWGSFAMLFGYIAASPFIVQKLLGIPPFWYTIDFGFNGVLMIVTGWISAALSHRVSPRTQAWIGISMQLVSAAVLGLAVVLNALNPVTVLGAFALIPASLSFLFGPATALALRDVRHLAGTALAIMGAIQFLIGGAVATLVGVAGERAVWPLACCLAIGSVASLLALVSARKYQK
jgi:DHA1 family bicyclomycin/chloramphenicol resistance-like MFS transporter